MGSYQPSFFRSLECFRIIVDIFSHIFFKNKEEFYHDPKGHHETGLNLASYIIENKLNWLSFQTANIHDYTTQYWRSNLKIKDKIERRNIIYHQSTSCLQNLSVRGVKQIDEFREA